MHRRVVAFARQVTLYVLFLQIGGSCRSRQIYYVQQFGLNLFTTKAFLHQIPFIFISFIAIKKHIS